MNSKSDNGNQISELSDKSTEFRIQNSYLQSECERLQSELTMREKELDTIKNLSSLPVYKIVNLNGFLQGVLKIIQNNYPDPETICARITVGNNHLQTEHFVISNRKQSQVIVTDGRVSGLIEVFYSGQENEILLGQLPEKDQNLLKVIADWLGKGIKCLESDLMQDKIITGENEWQHLEPFKGETSMQTEPGNTLGESESKYRDLVDFSTSIVLEWDTEGRIVYLNKHGLDFFGFTPGELYGRHVVGTIVEPFDPDGTDLEEKMKIVPKSPDGFYSSENENVKKNGEKVWIAWTNKGIYNADGQLIKTLSVGIDRTRQYKLEKMMIKYREELEKKVKKRTKELIKSKAELEESEKKYRLIAENTSDGILIIGADTRIKYMSPSYVKLLGYTEEETVSKGSDYIYSLIHPEDRDQLFSGIYEAIDQKRSTLIYSYRALHKKGHYVWREDHAKFNYDENNEHIDTYIICRDITERREAEDRIRQNEERLQGILDNMQDAFFQTDISGNFSSVNPMALKMYGYNSTEDLIGKPALLLYADKNVRDTLIDNLKATGKATDFIAKGLKKDGTTFWVSMNIQFIYDDRGNVCGTEGVVRDISQRIKMENEIVAAKEESEKNEKKYRTLFHSMQEGVYLHKLEFDRDGNPVNYRIIEANSASEKSLGIKNEDAFGKLATELFGTHKAPFLDIYANVARTGLPYAFEEYFEPMGKHFYISVFSAEKDEFATVFLDITKQKQHEAELFKAKQTAEENEKKLLISQEIAKLGGWELNIDTGIFTFNDSFYNIFHTNAKEMGGYQMTIHEYTSQFVHPDDAVMVAEETKKAIETNDPNFSEYLEHRFLFKEGGTGYLSVRFYIEKDVNGRTIKTFGVNQDITEKRKAGDELIKAKERAEQSDRFKTAFLLNISHEIRTPMNGILGFMSLLEEPGLTENEKSDYIRIVNKSGERLMNTINDIVEISKIEAGDISLTKQDFDVAELMQYHYDFFKLQTEEKGLEFDMDLKVKGEAAIINSDKQKLDSILMNLIRNAVKFTAKGKIEMGSYLENNELCFYVQDTGRGIPKEKTELIFDRFVQVEQGYSRGYEGLGIGLSIVKAYLDALNGTIEVISEVDRGSTFLFSIPYCPAIQKADISKEIENKDVPAFKTILVAEDDPVNYYLLEAILSGEYRLLHAFNGEEVVAILAGNPDIQLILLDIKMPGKFDGFEAARQIRTINRIIPIIAQTAYATETDKLKAKEAGCNHFLTKPYTRAGLLSLIREYVSR